MRRKRMAVIRVAAMAAILAAYWQPCLNCLLLTTTVAHRGQAQATDERGRPCPLPIESDSQVRRLCLMSLLDGRMRRQPSSKSPVAVLTGFTSPSGCAETDKKGVAGQIAFSRTAAASPFAAPADRWASRPFPGSRCSHS